MNRRLVALFFLALTASPSAAQQAPPPALRAGSLPSGITIDGRLDEPAWDAADRIDAFTQSEPTEGAAATMRTVVRVLAGAKAVVIGIVC